jgi:hypothetical protein
MILKGLAVVAFFANVRASSFCVHLPCLVCIQSVVRGDGVVFIIVIKCFAGKKPQQIKFYSRKKSSMLGGKSTKL